MSSAAPWNHAPHTIEITSGAIRKILTDVFLVRPSERGGLEVLLGEKKRGWMTGILNGFGGKLEPGEGILEAAKRELREGIFFSSTRSAGRS